MALFKKDKDAPKGFVTKSGRWVAPQQQAPAQPAPAQPPVVEAVPPLPSNRTSETLAQIDLDIPGMVVLRSKEDRYLGRLNQDIRAKEEFESGPQPVIQTGAPAAGSLEPELQEAARLTVDLLVARERITPQAGQEVLTFALQMGMSIVDALINSEVMKAHDIGTFLSEEFKAPFSRLEVLRVHPNTVGVLSPAEIQHFQVIPLSKIGRTLNLAVVNPLGNPALDRLKKESGFEIKAIICTASTLNNTSQQFYG
ncbi:MAG: hypothetical protein ABIF71_12635 [Planctomycetota bacterium]